MTPDEDAIVSAARLWLGTPYRHQAATLGAGSDCLGLVRGVWQTLYGADPLPAPTYRADWRDDSGAADLLAAAQTLLRPANGPIAAGQVLLFRLHPRLAPKHVGIATGPACFIHAQEGQGCIEASLTDAWRRRVAATFVFPPKKV